MPGETYTQEELRTMSRGEFETAAANNFRRGSVEGARIDVDSGHPHPALTNPAAGINVTESYAEAGARPDASPYAPNVWGAAEYDFTVPSGQRCRLRKLPIEELLKEGILDQLTRLPGMAEDLVQKAEGAPPSQEEMPPREAIEAIVEVCNRLLPMVVVAPVIFPMPEAGEQRDPLRIYPDSIDIFDRVAIMEQVVAGVKKLDRFRNAQQPRTGMVNVKVPGLSAI